MKIKPSEPAALVAFLSVIAQVWAMLLGYVEVSWFSMIVLVAFSILSFVLAMWLVATSDFSRRKRENTNK